MYAKGVDFLSLYGHRVLMIEVKNCTGYENENRWRTVPRPHRPAVYGAQETSSMNFYDGSFDIDVAEKVAKSIDCLFGAFTYGDRKSTTSPAAEYWRKIACKKFSEDQDKLYVILVLEGNFGSATKTKKIIMHSLQQALQKELRWLNCTALVMDSASFDNRD